VCVCQLRRLAGGSHKRRGREEALNNIVDILGDEVMEDVRVYQRHYGEDPSITKLYKVDNSKLKTPTSNQKRKHQITWLAHEAKERELELQKHWAVGSQARKDSRSKYGF
jgi:proline-rich protein PRCC